MRVKPTRGAMHRTRRITLAAVAPAVLALAACRRPAPERNPLSAPPVDTARIRSVEEAASWKYRRGVAADLDGDGRAERVFIVADATLGADGAPLWEDGHRWAVYVEAPGGERTLLYGAFVPNGFAEAAVLARDDTGRREVLVQERTPQRLRSVTVAYAGPHRARSVSDAYYHLGEWLPGSASMR